MGHSDISVTMNVYTHISFDDAEEELKRMEEFRKAQAEIEKKNDARAECETTIRLRMRNGKTTISQQSLTE